MGNNESFPPPPPGGNPPPPQQYPPQQYPPQQPYQQPTQQQPQYQPQQPYQQPTQQQPQYQQPYGGQQYGQFPQGAAPAPKKNTGLIVGIGVVVVAAIVAGVLILGGGDDDKTVKPTDSTAAVVTTASNDTIVLTLPGTTLPVNPPVGPTTTLGTTPDGFPVTDDTGALTVLLPTGADYATESVMNGDTALPRVIASADVSAFVSDDSTPGLIVLGIPSSFNANENDVIDALSPAGGTCGIQTPGTPMQTPFGVATVVLFDACGPGGAYSKVIMGVTTNGTLVAIGVYLQGEGPAVDMLDTAESMWSLITVN